MNWSGAFKGLLIGVVILLSAVGLVWLVHYYPIATAVLVLTPTLGLFAYLGSQDL
jgi:hypothetical protein